MRGRSAMAWGALASSAGCSFLMDTSNLVGASPDSDAGRSVDVEVESDSAPDGGGRSCAGSSAKLCDDFDRGTVAAFWDLVDPRVAVDDADSLSSPWSLLVSSTLGDGQPNVAISKRLPTAHHVHVTCAIRIDANGGAGWIDYVLVAADPVPAGFNQYKVGIGTNTADYRLQRVAFVTSGSRLDRSDSFLSGDSGWSRLGLDVVFDQGRVAASVDGREVMVRDDLPKIDASSTQISFGMPYVDTPNGPWRVRVDDVTIDWD